MYSYCLVYRGRIDAAMAAYEWYTYKRRFVKLYLYVNDIKSIVLKLREYYYFFLILFIFGVTVVLYFTKILSRSRNSSQGIVCVFRTTMILYITKLSL
jgi:hypothetical protein